MTTERDDGDTAQRPGPLSGPGPHERSGLYHESESDQSIGSTKTCLATSTGRSSGLAAATAAPVAAPAAAVAAVATGTPPTAALTTAAVVAGAAGARVTVAPVRVALTGAPGRIPASARRRISSTFICSRSPSRRTANTGVLPAAVAAASASGRLCSPKRNAAASLEAPPSSSRPGIGLPYGLSIGPESILRSLAS